MGCEFESQTPLARKALENHLVKFTFLEEIQSLVSATLEFEYATRLNIKASRSFIGINRLEIMP